jgi:signal transduction histidine kinase
MTFIGKEKMKVVGVDTNIKVRVAAVPTGKGETEIAGSLSMILAMSDKTDQPDSFRIISRNTSIFSLLDSNFTASMQNARLPIGFQVTRLEGDSLCPDEVVRSGSYTDLASGESYVAELSDYQGYILGKMWAEILFSFGLFACVSLSFFTVFRNLQIQRRLTELKNDFIQNVTHELKTPIATVGVAIEALRNFDALQDPARTREYLDISKNELNRLSLLVDKVLRMSLFDRTEIVLHLEPVDLQALVSEILSSLKLQFEKQGARVSFEQTESRCVVNGDRLHLTSLVYNLLDNALKYSLGQPEINVRLHPEANNIRLEISDRGIGIAPEHRDRIFEKFYRVPTGTVHNVKGHGLGLSYVANVVEKHGGSSRVDEREGGGVVFCVLLPSM